MDSFEKLVKDCRKNKSDRIIHNASIDHAAILVDNLLESSKYDKAKVSMVSGKLTDSFYSPLSEKFKECLDNGSKVEIVVLDEADLSENTLAKLVEVHENGSLLKKILPPDKQFPHFILVGGNRFRAETDPELVKAIASFNVPGTGKILKSIFEQLTSLPNQN